MDNEVPVRAISRAILVLQALNRHGSTALTELSRAVNLPYPTTCRIVRTLIHEGLVECEETRKYYRVTRLVQSLSLGFEETGILVSVVRPHISALTKKISWPVSVSTRVGQSMVVRDSTHAETSLTFTNYQPGYTFPVLESASGQVYLAHAADEERVSVLRGIELSDGRTASLIMFDSERNIRRIREDGYAVYSRSPHTPTPGKTSSISVPIYSHGKVCAALTLMYFSSAMPIEKAISNFLADLKATSKAIGSAVTKATLANGKVKL